MKVLPVLSMEMNMLPVNVWAEKMTLASGRSGKSDNKYSNPMRLYSF